MDSEAESPAAGRWRFQDIEVESGAEGDPVREGLWGLGIGKGVARTSAPGVRGRDSPKPRCPSVVQVDGENSAGQTALYLSALLGHSSAVELLLASGANPNHRCLDGSTPVHAGAFSGRSLVLLHLLQAGGDLRLRDQQGHSPQDWAEQGGAKQSWETLELLQLCRAHMSALVHGSELAPAVSLGQWQASSGHSLCGGLHLVQANRAWRPEQTRRPPHVPALGFGQLSSLWPLGLVTGVPLADPKELLPAQGEPDRTYRSSSHTLMANLLWRGHPVTVRQLKVPGAQADVLLADLQHCRPAGVLTAASAPMLCSWCGQAWPRWAAWSMGARCTNAGCSPGRGRVTPGEAQAQGCPHLPNCTHGCRWSSSAVTRLRPPQTSTASAFWPRRSSRVRELPWAGRKGPEVKAKLEAGESPALDPLVPAPYQALVQAGLGLGPADRCGSLQSTRYLLREAMAQDSASEVMGHSRVQRGATWDSGSSLTLGSSPSPRPGLCPGHSPTARVSLDHSLEPRSTGPALHTSLQDSASLLGTQSSEERFERKFSAKIQALQGLQRHTHRAALLDPQPCTQP
ncbi:PREDICTED: uncharacterized protein LOC104995258 isoform X2 [Bison bison bison]|uniref:Uncharacterized protein LOC104995258 isoform X2 n=1 Tax=Bison bison bison TaxID=43346 RepID=A0A6P3I8X8_BISBB|nr:PREDICTED: uncharacterized protein LOC104995258 isoform X2 [Bison bison bison]